MYLPGTAFEIWQRGCKDPNNLNDQIQGPCNDAAAGPNGSGRVLESRRLLEEPGPKAVGCRTMNRRMRMHEQYHLGFRNAVEKKHTTVPDWTIQNEKATVARLLESLFATTWPYIVFLDSTTFESMLLDTLGASQSASRGKGPNHIDVHRSSGWVYPTAGASNHPWARALSGRVNASLSHSAWC